MMKVKTKLVNTKVALRKFRDYVRYDLKDIAFPPSLPDPPDLIKPVKRRKLTWSEHWDVLKKASRLYAASWKRDIRPDLYPEDYKNDDLDEGKTDTKEKEPSIMEDLAVAAKGGMVTLRPALQRLYMTRASAYKDALKSFIVGYKEGIQEVMEKKEHFQFDWKDDTPSKDQVDPHK